MRWLSVLAVALLACAACQPLPDASPAANAEGQAQPAQAPSPPPCTSYTVPVTVGGQPQQAVVEACPQPDGSWRITQTTPGLPPQVYDVPPPPVSRPYSYDYAYASPDYFPYWWGAPWFFGLAPSIVVVQRFNHFHRGFGFHHGFGHGFMHGMHGFAGGFTAARGGAMGGGHR